MIAYQLYANLRCHWVTFGCSVASYSLIPFANTTKHPRTREHRLIKPLQRRWSTSNRQQWLDTPNMTRAAVDRAIQSM